MLKKYTQLKPKKSGKQPHTHTHKKKKKNPKKVKKKIRRANLYHTLEGGKQKQKTSSSMPKKEKKKLEMRS